MKDPGLQNGYTHKEKQSRVMTKTWPWSQTWLDSVLLDLCFYSSGTMSHTLNFPGP